MKLGVTVTLFFMSISTSAGADLTKAQCAEADTHAQTARAAGKLREARAQLDICTSQACPTLVRQDCAERLDEVAHATPSVVLDAQDAAGNDILAVRITMDGEPLVDHLDGVAISIDPGDHAFVFSVPGMRRETVRMLVHEGDKERRVHVILGRHATAHADSKEHSERRVWTTPRMLTVVFGSVGLAALGLGAGFGGAAISSWNASVRECSSQFGCTSHPLAVSDHDTAVAFATTSTTAFVIGGALAATGVIALVVSLVSPESPPRRVGLSPMIARDAIGMSLSAVFR